MAWAHDISLSSVRLSPAAPHRPRRPQLPQANRHPSRLIANLRTLLDEYITREIIVKDSYQVHFELVGPPRRFKVYVKYTLNNYDNLKDKMTQSHYNYDCYKVRYYCHGTGYMITSSRDIICYIYDEYIMENDNQEPRHKRHHAIY